MSPSPIALFVALMGREPSAHATDELEGLPTPLPPTSDVLEAYRASMLLWSLGRGRASNARLRLGNRGRPFAWTDRAILALLYGVTLLPASHRGDFLVLGDTYAKNVLLAQLVASATGQSLNKKTVSSKLQGLLRSAEGKKGKCEVAMWLTTHLIGPKTPTTKGVLQVGAEVVRLLHPMEQLEIRDTSSGTPSSTSSKRRRASEEGDEADCGVKRVRLTLWGEPVVTLVSSDAEEEGEEEDTDDSSTDDSGTDDSETDDSGTDEE